jgi:putative resolvase
VRVTEAARYIGVSVNTLKAMSDSGKIICHRTSGGHRRYHKEYLDRFMGVTPARALFEDKFTLVYARCSTAKQKENLVRQKDRLIAHAESKGYTYQVIDEIASGINERRWGLHKLIKLVMTGRVERVLIEYKDRLARFGYEYLLAICKHSGVEVEVVNDREQKYEEELAEDIMKILTCYSARYYGARGGRKGNKKALPVGAQLVLDSIESEPQGE